MDHVTLTAYPFPEGVTIPRLMPFQEFPFNGDGYLAAEVLRLKEAHGLTCAVETGTCLGSTTCWLVENFPFHVRSYEINQAYCNIAEDRLELVGIIRPMIDLVRGDSKEIELVDIDGMGDRAFVFLDAHWNEHCPLLDELEAIARANVKPCILIHDFQVPGTDFGFDRFPDSGYPFSLEAVAPHLDAIYGAGKWKHNYPTKVEGARRGWISLFPADVHH